MSEEALEGLSALEDDLAQLPNRIAKAAVQRVLRRGGQVIAEAWTANARVRKRGKGGHGPAGRYKLSIKVASRIHRFVKQFQASQTAPAAVAYVGPTDDGYPEAMFEEFGAHTNHHNETATFPGRRAWEAQKQAALNLIGAQLWPEIAKTSNRFFKRQGG